MGKQSLWTKLGLIGTIAIAFSTCLDRGITAPLPTSPTQLVQTNAFSTVKKLARLTTVRILTPYASGSGVIIAHQGKRYKVLTNWHVVGFSDRHTIMTADGQRHTPISARPRQLGSYDLAITEFTSKTPYKVAKSSHESIEVGEEIFAVGFPMYFDGTQTTTFSQGMKVFRLTQGTISLLPPNSMERGYRLGYTNEIVEGMSGGPIFNTKGLLIGVNGRLKYGEPAFGIYEFIDGSQPSPDLLQRMVGLSWGIPIQTYLQFVSHQ